MPPQDVLFHRIVAGFGLLAMIGFAWLLSSHRKRFPWRVVIGGLLIQIVLVLVILGSEHGRAVFQSLGDGFTTLLSFVDEGCKLVFGDKFTDFYFAFRVLPTIIFFSALMAVLYHLGVMQLIIRGLAWVLRYTLGTSGAESLSAAANIFVGQTEAPFVVRPYIPLMTKSELMAIMTGGFATVAGGVMALYIGWGIDAGHLITASFISAPAGLLIAKVILPETETPQTSGGAKADIPIETSNVIEAATHGASEGLKLALNVAAMLIAFMGLIAMFDYLLSTTSLLVMNNVLGMESSQGLTLSRICGYLFSPLAWLMGIEWKDCFHAGELLGFKMVANELIAYDHMRGMMNPESGPPVISNRTTVIMTYALSGFSSFASIGIQVGGIGGLCPERRTELAKLGLRAMLGGTLACCMTACVAGIVIGDVADEKAGESSETEDSQPTDTDELLPAGTGAPQAAAAGCAGIPDRMVTGSLPGNLRGNRWCGTRIPTIGCFLKPMTGSLNPVQCSRRIEPDFIRQITGGPDSAGQVCSG
jgi:CNT family concentrative nucleoside transporter